MSAKWCKIEPPPQHEKGSFVDYHKRDAAALARKLKKHVGERVVVYGGGGSGSFAARLKSVQVTKSLAAKRDDRGKVVRDASGNWIPDRSLPPTYQVVPVLSLSRAAARSMWFAPRKSGWKPFYGSWRLAVRCK